MAGKGFADYISALLQIRSKGRSKIGERMESFIIK